MLGMSLAVRLENLTVYYWAAVKALSQVDTMEKIWVAWMGSIWVVL